MLEDLFTILKNQPSDINEHLETLRELASECNTVVEFGVRNIVSTVSLAVSGCKNLHSYDINDASILNPDRFMLLKMHCEKNNINFKFNKCDILKLETIPECEMLFIDTFHAYAQLKCELFFFSNKVKNYIVMHDTVCFSKSDETVISKENWFNNYKNDEKICNLVKIESEKSGLISAIEEFLELNPEWKILKQYTNNNGLTILKRSFPNE